MYYHDHLLLNTNSIRMLNERPPLLTDDELALRVYTFLQDFYMLFNSIIRLGYSDFIKRLT